MPAWPKSIITFGANLLTASTAMRLRRHDRGVGAQRRAFQSLVSRLGTTTFWREAGIQGGMSYPEFKSRVALRGYNQLKPAIERMQHGEPDVLWPGVCRLFVSTSGTNDRTPKILPVTAPMLRHFRAGCRDALLYYTARIGHAGVLRGRHLFLTGSTAMKPIEGVAGGAFVGDWPAIAALNLPRWAEAQLFEPGTAIAEMTDWPAKVDAIIARTLGRDVSLIAGIPPWVLQFAEAVRAKPSAAGAAPENLQAIWPNLECFVHGGVPIAPYQADLRAALGPTVQFHEVYAAAEGILAAQDTTANAGLRVIGHHGLFFEFLPLADFDESRLEQIGEKAVRLGEVKTGIDYVILLTSPAGLARCVIGDVVRFTSTEPPRLNYVGRTALQLSTFGEHVIEKEITDVLLAVCQRHRWTIVNFHVAPLFATDLTGQARGRHEWWVELRPGTVETPTGPQMAVELDLELQRLNRDYANRRASGRIDSPTVRLVMPGVFRHWLRFHGRWGGQNKIARCRTDRLIADELAQITRFAQD